MLQSILSGYEPPYIIPNLTIYHSVIHLTSVNGLRVGAARAEDVQGTPTQSCITMYTSIRRLFQGLADSCCKKASTWVLSLAFSTLGDVH